MAEAPKTKSARSDSLEKFISSKLGDYPRDAEIDLFRDWFARRYGANLAAVIFFGSCLSEKSKSATSFKDFILVVDQYRTTSKNPLQWLSHWILPPDLFHLSLLSNAGRHECKYYLISRRQLSDAAGDKAKDLYLLGRLSKRIAVIYFRDDQSLREIVSAQAGAMRRAAGISLGLLDRFDKPGFIKAVMRLSYLAETRLEDETKVDSLYAAHAEFYDDAYGIVLNEFLSDKLIRREGDGWKPVGGKIPLARREVDQLLIQSRRRAKARWPKMIITVDNWLEQLLAKLERTYGVKLDIPKWEKPFILITGWRHYFRLKREGKIHEHRAEK